MTEPQKVTALAARREFRTVIDRAYVDKLPTVITRHGEPVAVVVPYHWYETHAGSNDTITGDDGTLPTETDR